MVYMGVRQVDCDKWRALISHLAVVNEVEKNKSVLVVCPKGFCERAYTMAIESFGFSGVVAKSQVDAIKSRIQDSRDHFSYCGVGTYDKHIVGRYKVIPKESALEERVRPLGNYSKHALRNLLTLGSRVMVMLSMLVAGYDFQGASSQRASRHPIPIIDSKKCVETLNAERLHWSDFKRAGHNLMHVRQD